MDVLARSLISRSYVVFFSSYLSTGCRVFLQGEEKCAAADGQQAVIWTWILLMASGDQMSTVRDQSSHCVDLRDSPPLQPSILSLAPLISESLRALSIPSPRSSFSSMLTCVSPFSYVYFQEKTYEMEIQFNLKNVICPTANYFTCLIFTCLA